jgi:hypothetical protein
MRTLLKALLSFWDRLYSRNASDNEEGGNKFMGGIIASIRYLSVSISHTPQVFDTYVLTRTNRNA